jgi:O-antigen/teichoic acid export membrane protein
LFKTDSKFIYSKYYGNLRVKLIEYNLDNIMSFFKGLKFFKGRFSLDKYINGFWGSVFKVGIISTINKFFNIFIRIITIPIIINYLGKEQYGLWITVSSFVGYIMFFDFGISSAAINNLVKFYSSKNYKVASNYVFANVLFLSTICLVIFGLTIFGVNQFNWVTIFKLSNVINVREINSIIILCVSIFLFQLSTNIFLKIPYTMQMGYLTEIYLFVGYVLSLVFVLLCVHFDFGFLLLILAFSFSLIFAPISIFIHLVVKKYLYFEILSIKENVFVVKGLLKVGTSILMMQLCGMVIMSSQFGIIAYFKGTTEVVVYSVLLQIMNALQTPFSVLQQPLWAKFAKLALDNKILLIKTSVIQYIKLSFLYSIFVTFVIILITPFFISYLIKETVNVNLLLLIGFSLWSLFGLVFGGGIGAAFLALDQSKKMLNVSLLQMVLFLLFSVILVPKFGDIGMVYTLVFMQLFSSPLMMYYIRFKFEKKK